ncbi:undecaprenyldiphospho-muramoylpentapeptide beta-N-acetylglucosaminyltransferase [Thorsellia anophelis]|uniref:UDP-N-acetylglucosamine--N-acetylmuramyl-(pentapeptide) pyrophosphoryl-undecaprenol N-acetylglucosamine transferase n=1 Tax=Thorsellia anophelis DSM 18579 TaxID=1123402 RepID=A0A1H9ZBK3_9GAMM|nr:undecaprenyldiphospho-muramoylpentapeptide beta-N-acetylglucosaminyltransferase [Thorsellia anophelis]SES78998.1 UDP-N-acetylglucosamine-N-acetylmuramylpentapeptide N-acetylglucosamine transferase [Thorsellia anophelis DSM 18579]
MKNQPRLLVMAGGTGGHIFPALAVAQYLERQGWRIDWLGTQDRMEAALVPKYGIKLHCIEVQGLKGKNFLSLIKAPLMLFKAILQARKIINEIKPDVVLGMGGYVSGPGGIAAYLTKTPLLIHEQNGVAGLTNQWLSKLATTVMQAFGSAFDPNYAEVVGNPVREIFFKLPSPSERYPSRVGKLKILIVGGSQGAKVLNDVMPPVASKLNEMITITHQVGKGNVEKVRQAYAQYNILDNIVTEFIDDIQSAYLEADLIICRSGALTVSELAAIGVPAIFVPFMHKDNQQLLNAKWLADNDAAIILEQKDLTADKLTELITSLDRTKLLAMAESAKLRSMPNATRKVAEKLIELAQK